MAECVEGERYAHGWKAGGHFIRDFFVEGEAKGGGFHHRGLVGQHDDGGGFRGSSEGVDDEVLIGVKACPEEGGLFVGRRVRADLFDGASWFVFETGFRKVFSSCV